MWTIAWNINSKPKNFQIWKSCVNFLEKFSGHTHIICKYVKTGSVLLVYCCFSSFPHRLAMILPNKSLKLNKTIAWNAFLHTQCPNALEISITLVYSIFLISHSREYIGSVDGIHFNFLFLFFFSIWTMGDARTLHLWVFRISLNTYYIYYIWLLLDKERGSHNSHSEDLKARKPCFLARLDDLVSLYLTRRKHSRKNLTHVGIFHVFSKF